MMEYTESMILSIFYLLYTYCVNKNQFLLTTDLLDY